MHIGILPMRTTDIVALAKNGFWRDDVAVELVGHSRWRVSVAQSNLQPAAQVFPRTIQSLTKVSSHLDGGGVAAGFHELQVAHRDLCLFSQCFLGQPGGGAQSADVLAEMGASFTGHRLDCGRSKRFDSEAYFVFF